MSWLTRHRLRRYLRSSLFLAPAGSIVLALAVAPFVRWIDDRTQWTLLGFGAGGASAVLSGLSSSLLALIVFAFSILLLAIQIAGGQLSPRIIARVFRMPLLKVILSGFVFSYASSLAALSRIGERVPQLPVALAIAASLASLAVFIYLVQRIGEAFRPGTVMAKIAAETRDVLDAMYPRALAPGEGEHVALSLDPSRADRIVFQQKVSGVVLAFDAEGLRAVATRAGCVVELVPQVGDFLAVGEPLFRLEPSTTSQEAAARHYLRPHDSEVAAKYADRFPKIDLLTIEEVFGSWKAAEEKHFSQGGTFDRNREVQLVTRYGREFVSTRADASEDTLEGVPLI